MIWNTFKKLFFLSDAEAIHQASVLGIQQLGRFSPKLIEMLAGGRPEIRSTNILGITYRAPVGLAAGFDKNGEILEVLPHFGFGFAEIGTVTPQPQLGNERPRLFRDPKRESLFNRMGFNSDGIAVVRQNLEKKRQKLPSHFRIGVNLGKNRATPFENAATDYQRVAEQLDGLADYLVVNVSSPNTPGLRALQTAEHLHPIVHQVANTISKWSDQPPVFLKLAPDLNENESIELVRASENWPIAGWVLTNTRPGFYGAKQKKSLSGGWSGGCLTEMARRSLEVFRSISPLPIISVGGISNTEEACLRFKLGANLIQIYSSWIYRGPSFPNEIVRALRGK